MSTVAYRHELSAIIEVGLRWLLSNIEIKSCGEADGVGSQRCLLCPSFQYNST